VKRVVQKGTGQLRSSPLLGTTYVMIHCVSKKSGMRGPVLKRTVASQFRETGTSTVNSRLVTSANPLKPFGNYVPPALLISSNCTCAEVYLWFSYNSQNKQLLLP
jgi:hypothetical protein